MKRLSLDHKLADLMAEGCPSISEAAYRLKQPLVVIEKLWAQIWRGLGRQGS